MNRLKIIFILMLSLPAEAFASFSCVGGNCTVTCDGTNDQSFFMGAMSGVSDGGIITVSGGTCGFSGPASYSGPKGFTLQGAGIDSTIIADYTGTEQHALEIEITADKLLIVTGFTFDGRNVHHVNGGGQIQVSGVSKRLRIHHNKLTNMGVGRGIIILGAGWLTYGVIDHVTFEKKFDGSLQSVTMAEVGGNGNGAWGAIYSFEIGSEKALYIEDCTFDYTSHGESDGAFDAYGGARYVFRHNTLIETTVGHHGTDSTGAAGRSAHSWEIYSNTFYAGNNHPSTAFLSRGGTGVWWNNDYHGNFNGAGDLANYRSCDSFADFGQCQWGNAFDGNEDPPRNGYPCLDQNGMTNGGTIGWGLQRHMPVYEWSNSQLGYGGDRTISFVTDNCAAEVAHIQQGRDWFTASQGTSVPGSCSTVNAGFWSTATNTLYKCNGTSYTPYYTPYPYPHPLISGESVKPTAPQNLRIAQ